MARIQGNGWLLGFLCVMVLLGLGSVSSLDAQVTQAFYPLIDNLADQTGNYGDMVLAGNNPPVPPTPGNPLCINGVYGDQDAITPNISTFDSSDFQIDVEFMLTGFAASYGAPVIMGGPGWRFIGYYVDPSGVVGVKYNNSELLWSSTTVALGQWYQGQIRYDSGEVQLFLDGELILYGPIGPLSHSSDFSFTTTDFSVGRTLNGCIRNLGISNDSTVPVELQRFSVE